MNHLQLRDLTDTTRQLAAVDTQIDLLKRQADGLRKSVLTQMTDNGIQTFDSPVGQFVRSTRVTVKVVDEEALVRTLQERERRTGFSLVEFVPGHLQPSEAALNLIKTGVLQVAESVNVTTTSYVQVKKNS